MSRILKGLGVIFIAVAAQAQMPHEVLLLVNSNSQPSMLAANTFASLRMIPKQNIVYLNLPQSAYGGSATVTPSEFTDLIWKPAWAAAKKQGVEKRIMAWVYSVDFPIRVKTSSKDRKQMSVGGLTFLRNQIPDLNLVEKGEYLSKLFSGPNKKIKSSLSALSLGVQKKGLGEKANVPDEVVYLRDGLGKEMPLPSMMLGYIGEKGNDIQTVVKMLKRGKQSDYRGSHSGFYFVTSDDVRSKCREWQYAPAVEELKKRGLSATITTNFPAGAEKVMGLLMGAEKVDISAIKSFYPGAMAEHLTSWSAEFQKPQTKATEWIAAGATATAGAVVEPYSNPNKFPSARFFIQYASGCTMLESFYQSIACPLQSLLLGDPLAKPYSPRINLKILGLDRLTKDFTFITEASSKLRGGTYLYTFFVDGKEVQATSEDPTYYLRLLRFSDGYHELRAVVYMKHFVEFNSTVIKSFSISRLGRSIAIRPEITKISKHKHRITVRVGGEENPDKIRLVSGETLLDEKPYDPEMELTLNELLIGEGPNSIRVVAVYPDGMEVSSAPGKFEITFAQ